MFNRRIFGFSLLSLLPIPFFKRNNTKVEISSLNCSSSIKCNNLFVPELTIHFNAEGILDGIASMGEDEMAKLLGNTVISECRAQWNIVMPEVVS